MNRIIHSSKFLLAIADAVFSTVLLLAARFLSPSDVDLVMRLVVIYQPVVIAAIAGTAYEDGKVATAQAMAEAQGK